MGTNVAIDGSDMPAYADGQRFLYDGGPERTRYSDPDASWCHRSAVSTRSHGGFYGYKLDMAVNTATHALDVLPARGFNVQTCGMDKSYDKTTTNTSPIVAKNARTPTNQMAICPTTAETKPLMARNLKPRHASRVSRSAPDQAPSAISGAAALVPDSIPTCPPHQ